MLSILWYYHITPWEGIGMTPFHLVYDKETMILVKIRMSYVWVSAYDEANVERRLLDLDLVGEARDKVVVWLRVNKQRMC